MSEVPNFRDRNGFRQFRPSGEGLVGKLVNWVIRTFVFDEARGRAWIKQNIEEVGNFESFLPKLYAIERGSDALTDSRPTRPLEPTS
jgi:hypothetical protein